MKLKNLIALTVMLTAVFSFLSAVMYINRNAVLGVNGRGSDVTVVIDAGHGGVDPGSVSADGLLEKDVNLDIALKLNDILIQKGVKTLLVRNTDTDISDPGCSSVREKKVSDIHNRFALVNETPGSILVSIHQNFYEETKYSGTQVFYSANNDESRVLAGCIQSAVVSGLQPDNTRQIKASGDSIYLLYRAERPSVMVECGFLSNPEESKKLADGEYRQSLAQFVSDGIMNYLGGNIDGAEE
ncbi:MAG: N-acetylmuramoyl-L-alanine amidase [Oscillospiraceae bacterium]|nr:N-acetylmuramoyl-L-alanine amidase [Oscillospiraceae bacterium]